MAIIREFIRRLGYLVRRQQMEDELLREMEAHRALMEDPRAFGNTLRLREEARDAWGWNWLDDLVHDTRFAWRTLRHSPGFVVTAMVTLALGIGVNIGMFTVVNGLLLRPLYERPDQVVSIYGRSTAPDEGIRGISYPNYLDLEAGTTSVFSNLAASSTVLVGLDAGEGARRTLASGVTANYFDVFEQSPTLGRPFTTEEEKPGADNRVAMVSHSYWTQRGADPGLIGRTLRINGVPFTVIAVAPRDFAGASIPGPDVWLPLGAQTAFEASTSADGTLNSREAHTLSVVGRLRSDASIESAAAAVATVGRRLAQAFPTYNAGYTLQLTPPSRFLFMPGPGSSAFTAILTVLLMAMPAIVLLVACLNLADLLLARGHVRRQELAIRASLGGGRGRLTRQLLTEGLLLALAAGVAGLLLSRWATDALLTSLRPVIPVALSLPELDFDWRVLVGAVGFSLLASVVFGIWPAWLLTGRAAVTDLKRQAGEEGRRLGSVRVGNALVIGQVSLSVLLLAVGGLFLASAISAATADPGFRLDRGLVVELDSSLAGYNESRGREANLALVERMRAVPGVEAVTISSSLPFTSFGDSRNVAPAGFADAQAMAIDAVFNVVGRDYARALGLPMLDGRDFTAAELAPGAEPVAIVDDLLARRLWPGDSALGRFILFVDGEGPEAGRTMRVVGITPTVRHSLSNPQPFPHVYVPLGQRYESAMTLQLRIAENQPEPAILATVSRVIREFDERLPIVRLETWRDHLDTGLDSWIYRAGATVFSAFGGIALLLAVIGVYGVKSYVVSRRTREFGIRIATGAHPRALLWQVMKEGGRITAIGLGIGLLLAVAAGRLLQGFLYGVDALAPVVLVLTPLILLASSLLASYIPALRATRVDPTVALRSE
jgi:putative ABC transport system permease protein